MIIGAAHFIDMYLLLGLVVWPALIWLRHDNITILLFSAAMGVSAWWAVTVSPWDFTNDIGGHIDYIRYIATKGALPPPLGWQTQQPPLYYTLAAAGFRLAYLFDIKPMHGARFVATLFYYAFAITSAGLLRYAIRTRWIYYLCLALVLFWPASAHTSVKITNDVPEAFFCILTFYCTLRWLREHHPRFLGYALAAVGLAFATKGTGLIAAAMVGAAGLWKCWRREVRWRALRHWSIALGLCVLVLGSASYFGRTLYWNLTTNDHVRVLINRDDNLAPYYDYVGNKFTDYVYFNAYDFVKTPFAPLDKREASAPLFWNVALKTLLFDGNGYRLPWLASALSGWFLAFLLFTGIFYLYAFRQQEQKRIMGFALVTVIMAFAMLMIARISVPVSNQCSARYIYFSCVLLVFLYGTGLQNIMHTRSAKGRVAKSAGMAAGGGMLVLSVAFIAAQLV